MALKTTKQVARLLQLPHIRVSQILGSYPELKPTQKSPTGAYLWTEEEVQRMVTHRLIHKHRARKKKAQPPDEG
jgi:hypothetical protein